MITRPVLRYPGGKYTIAGWVISHFPMHKTYVELYGGAASVLMRKPRSAGEVYNDLDEDVVNVFSVLRDPEQGARLAQLLELTPYSYADYKSAYKTCDDLVEQARRIIFRSFAGIGSDSVHKNNGFRGTMNGKGDTAAIAWSKYNWQIKQFIERLQGVVIENREACRIIPIYDAPGTLFYADPPYLRSSRSKESVHYLYEMNKPEEHEKLADALHGVRGMVVVSGYSSELYEHLYKGWIRVEHSAKDQTGQHRIECLWLSPNIKTVMF